MNRDESELVRSVFKQRMDFVPEDKNTGLNHDFWMTFMRRDGYRMGEYP